MSKFQMTEWSYLVGNHTAPVILHDCHNYCASTFSGATLVARQCDAGDPAQQWELSVGDNKTAGQWGYLRDAGPGLCVGCMTQTDCANTAGAPLWNTSGVGAGMQACVSGIGGAKNDDANYANPMQQYNYTAHDGRVLRADGACLELGPAGPTGARRNVVVQGAQKCSGTAAQKWTRGPVTTKWAGGMPRSQLVAVGDPSLCLAAGPRWQNTPDPWCVANNNMWRTNTDTLQQWPRIMQELESLVGLGAISRPGKTLSVTQRVMPVCRSPVAPRCPSSPCQKRAH